VGPTIGQDIDVETWIRGPIAPTLDSDRVHVTADIKFITLKAIGLPWSWPEQKVHAKLAIIKAGSWVCVGGVNRMLSQKTRGGGTTAFQDPALWALLAKTEELLVPPGWSAAEAKAAIQTSHAPAPSIGGSRHLAKSLEGPGSD
jgi:deoxyribonuclease-2